MRTIEEIKAEMERLEKEEEAFYDLSEEEQKAKEKEQFARFHRERELRRELNSVNMMNVKVGDGITLDLYSDSHAYTIIARTAKTITIQRDEATLKKDFKPEMVAGGFSAICTNQNDQEYDYERNPKGQTMVIRWSEKNQRWSAPKGYTRVSLGRHEFYDYNF